MLYNPVWFYWVSLSTLTVISLDAPDNFYKDKIKNNRNKKHGH